MADYSFIANPAKPPNLLEAAGQYGQAIGLANQNRLFQQTLRAKQAIGRAVQSAIGPDGSYDPAKANQLIAASSDAAFGAPEALEQTTAQRAQQASIANTQASTAATNIGAAAAQFKLGQERRSAVTGALLPLVRNVAAGKPIEDDQINDAGKQLLSNPAFNDDQSRQLIAQEVVGLLAKPGAERSATILNHFIGANATPAGVQTALGNQSAINTGAQTNLTMGGGVAPPQVTASLTNTLSPEAEAAPRTLTTPSGATQQVPTSAIVTPTGQPRPDVPGLTGPQGEIATSLAPGQAEGRAIAGQGSGQELAQDRAEANGSSQRLAVLKEVNQFLASPQGQTGPGTQLTNKWRDFLLTVPQALLPPGIQPDQIKAATQDEIKKYMTQIAGNAASQFGAGTNEKLAVAASGNANPDLSNLANRDVTRMNIALERAKQARLATFQASGQPAESYAQWAANWNRTTDPRAFMLDVLSKSERQKMLSGIRTDAEKRALLRGKQAAEAAGLYSEADIPR